MATQTHSIHKGVLLDIPKPSLINLLFQLTDLSFKTSSMKEISKSKPPL